MTSNPSLITGCPSFLCYPSVSNHREPQGPCMSPAGQLPIELIPWETICKAVMLEVTSAAQGSHSHSVMPIPVSSSPEPRYHSIQSPALACLSGFLALWPYLFFPEPPLQACGGTPSPICSPCSPTRVISRCCSFSLGLLREICQSPRWPLRWRGSTSSTRARSRSPRCRRNTS